MKERKTTLFEETEREEIFDNKSFFCFYNKRKLHLHLPVFACTSVSCTRTVQPMCAFILFPNNSEALIRDMPFTVSKQYCL